MEQNQLLAGTVEKNLPSFLEKILPAASSQWPSLVAHGTVHEGAADRVERVSLPAKQGAGWSTRKSIYQQSNLGPEGPIENRESKI